jgi:hypothetical protein
MAPITLVGAKKNPNGAAEEQRRNKQHKPKYDKCAARAGAEPNMASHTAGAVPRVRRTSSGQTPPHG